jgi:hypothetical protein
MREKLRSESADGDDEGHLRSGEGSMIEHMVPEGARLEEELHYLMGEVQRVTGLQEQVMRRLGGDDAGTDEDQSVSFEEDDDAVGTTAGGAALSHNSNISPGVRGEILDEFDNLIESNQFVDAEVLQAVLERLWSVTNEAEKEALIDQLGDEKPVVEQLNMTVEGLAEDCAEDIAAVENAISFLARKAKELCERELPFTIFNGQMLERCVELAREAMRSYRLNVLADGALFQALHEMVFRYERKSVAEHLDALVSEVSDLLYDEMLFASLYAKQNGRYEEVASGLHQQARKVELRLARLQAAQQKQHEVLLQERRVRLGKASRGESGSNVTQDMSFADAVNPINLDVTWDGEVLAESPGGFAFSPRAASPPSPSARQVYAQLLTASSPAAGSRSVDLVNKSLLDNFE